MTLKVEFTPMETTKGAEMNIWKSARLSDLMVWLDMTPRDVIQNAAYSTPIHVEDH